MAQREQAQKRVPCAPAQPTTIEETGGAFEKILREQRPELDGIEVMSNNMDRDLRTRAAGLLVKYPHFAQLGNSDSHDPATVGCCYTDFDADIRTARDLVEAIRGRKGVAKSRHG